MKNILLPTDFSENAYNAMKYALLLYKNQKCTFHILNTFTPAITHHRFVAKTQNNTTSDTIGSTSEQGLEKVLERIKKEFKNPNHTFTTISSFNLLTEEIKEIIDREKIELIILGNKGSSNAEQIFLGSTTVKILKSIKTCPLLIVPNDIDFISPSEIAFATDFNKFYTESEINPIVRLASSFDATVRIVHIQRNIKSLTEIQRFNLNILRKHLSTIEYYVHTISEVHSISKTLNVFIEELQIHLLAMLNSQHSYTKRLTQDSTVKQSNFYTKVPLLIIPELSDTYLSPLKENRKSMESYSR